MKKESIYKTALASGVLAMSLIFAPSGLIAKGSSVFIGSTNASIASGSVNSSEVRTVISCKPVTPVLLGGDPGAVVVTIDNNGNGDIIKGISFDVKYDLSIIDTGSFKFDLGPNSNWNLINASNNSQTGVIHIIIIPKQNVANKKRNLGDSIITIDFKLLPVDNVSGYTAFHVLNSNLNSQGFSSPDPNETNGAKIATNPLALNQNNDQNNFDDAVTVYPNPAQSFININLGTKTSDYITISDLNGKIVKVLKGGNSGNVKIEVDNLQGQVYIINIYTQCGIIVRKFVKLS